MSERDTGPSSSGALASRAVTGLAWTMSLSWATRAMQVAGTLAVTYVIDPDVLGEVTTAAILMLSAHQFSLLGIPQYLVTRARSRSDVNWHATAILGVAGVVVLAGVLLGAGPLGEWLKAPEIGRYLPWLALSAMMTRLGVVPERLLQQQLRFREVSLARGGSEGSYALVAVGLAFGGAGGMAIVGGNLVRSAVYLALMARAIPLGDWLKPHPYSSATARSILAYGLPITVATMFGFAARSWDTLLVSGTYGLAVVGAYNLAYQLADIPAVQVGEHIGDVLTPSFVRLGPERRRRALVRSTALLSLLVFPLAVGLGAVATTLVAALLRPEWSAVGPMLAVLSALGVVRPLGWTVSSYLQSTERPRAVMWLRVVNVVALFGAMFVLGRLLGPLGACAGVGFGFGVHAFAGIGVVCWADRIPVRGFAAGFFRPLLACVPMVLAVLVVRAALASTALAGGILALSLEVLAGAVVYIAAAFIVARPVALDLIGVGRQALARRRAARN